MTADYPAGYQGPLFVDSSNCLQIDCHVLAAGVRSDIVRLAYATRTHHIASALSCVDILVGLYFGFLRLPPHPVRDFFILSKGHAALAQYVVLAARRILPIMALRMYCSRAGLGQHPIRKEGMGIDVTTGSLGQGLSMGAGHALACRHLSRESIAVVLLGDGELNEGMVWEAACFAAHHKLGNLIAVVDRNSTQCLGRTQDILDMESIAEKFTSFGWSADQVNGHDIHTIESVLAHHNSHGDQPFVLVADTVKGKGVSFMENSVEWHHRRLDENDFTRALGDLE